jgi:hypothetical protein
VSCILYLFLLLCVIFFVNNTVVSHNCIDVPKLKQPWNKNTSNFFEK